jgi:hypothetical protein
VLKDLKVRGCADGAGVPDPFRRSVLLSPASDGLERGAHVAMRDMENSSS